MYVFDTLSLQMLCLVGTACIYWIIQMTDGWVFLSLGWLSVCGEKLYITQIWNAIVLWSKMTLPQGHVVWLCQSVNNELCGRWTVQELRPGLRFTATKENISAGEQTLRKVKKSLSVDKANVKCVSLLGNLHFCVPRRASLFPCLLGFLSPALSRLPTSLKRDGW